MSAKILYLIRGVPGSGKSSLARKIASDVEAVWLEADKYWDIVKLPCSRELLPSAHEWCRQEAGRAMEAGWSNVIVSNTFVKLWEMEPYRELAETFGYSVIVIEVTSAFENVHGVPAENVEAMYRNMQRIPFDER